MTSSVSAPASLQPIVDLVVRSLEYALDRTCPERYGGRLDLERESISASAATVRLNAVHPSPLRAQLTVHHVGGNVYDVHCEVADGPSRSFTYARCGDAGPQLPVAPGLGHKMADFLLDEVERQVGQRMLQRRSTTEAMAVAS
jgi:hypothetical protein